MTALDAYDPVLVAAVANALRPLLQSLAAAGVDDPAEYVRRVLDALVEAES